MVLPRPNNLLASDTGETLPTCVEAFEANRAAVQGELAALVPHENLEKHIECHPDGTGGFYILFIVAGVLLGLLLLAAAASTGLFALLLISFVGTQSVRVSRDALGPPAPPPMLLPPPPPPPPPPCVVMTYNEDRALVFSKTYTYSQFDLFPDEGSFENDSYYVYASAGCAYVTVGDADHCGFFPTNKDCSGCESESYGDNARVSSGQTLHLPSDLQGDVCGLFVHVK